MRRIILRMIAAGSLSAFSTAATQGAAGVRAPAGLPVQPVRMQATPPPVQPLALQLQNGGQPGSPHPGRILPRGSLLDLSV